ncbi:MAG: hypothetical protein JXO22_16500 [Phycisphaerae bacterium]|nr:hypothetical protein [Phycisphaerae bacterium]
MIGNRGTRAGTVVVAAVLAALAGGCDTSVMTGDSSSILDSLSEFGITEDMTIANVLNQVTVGDVLTGFVSFVDEVTSNLDAAMAQASGLSDEELAELETLQAQLDAGEITETEFGDAISEIIGDRGAGMPFAGLSFYGSPSGHRMNAGAAAVLDLTEEQQVAAEEIFQSLHDDIDALRAATHEAIRAMLTDEQLLILDDMGALDQESATPRMGRGAMGSGRGVSRSVQIADELQLTEEQQAAIDGLRAELRDAIRVRHEQAHAEFLALLTEEQLAALDGATEESE